MGCPFLSKDNARRCNFLTGLDPAIINTLTRLQRMETNEGKNKGGAGGEKLHPSLCISVSSEQRQVLRRMVLLLRITTFKGRKGLRVIEDIKVFGRWRE